MLRVGLDQQVSAVFVAKRKFRESDDHIPLMFVGLVVQSGQRSVYVLTSDRERFAHHLEGPVAPILAVGRMEVAEAARYLSGLGRVSDKADAYRLHLAAVPAALPQKRASTLVDRCRRSRPAAANPLIGSSNFTSLLSARRVLLSLEAGSAT
ncbi:hypothetical protein GCM10009872_38310 [Actinopolymorpha rutila]